MEEHSVGGAMEVEAELCAPSGKVQVVRYHFAEPPDSMLYADGRFRIELCLTGRHRSTRASFPDHWPAGRFERIGDLFIIPPNTEVIARSDEHGSLTAVVCEMRHDTIFQLFERRPELSNQLLLESLDIQHAKLRGILLQLAEEAKYPRFASERMADLLIRQLAIELVRHGAEIADRGANGGLSAWQLRAIDERLDEVREGPTIADLGKLCRLSARQLTRGFQTSRGCSLGAYVTNRQLEHAKRLLEADESVGAIATRLGFSSTSNFCFAFRRETGSTPGQYRRRLLRN